MGYDNDEIGQRIQEKFRFYVLGLTFTILALAIQTAKFGISAVADGLELFGWVVLFVSGVASFEVAPV